jgi:hypothetical protein
VGWFLAKLVPILNLHAVNPECGLEYFVGSELVAEMDDIGE